MYRRRVFALGFRALVALRMSRAPAFHTLAYRTVISSLPHAAAPPPSEAQHCLGQRAGGMSPFHSTACCESLWSTLSQTGEDPNAPVKANVPDVLKDRIRKLKNDSEASTIIKRAQESEWRDTVRFFQLVYEVPKSATGCQSLSQILAQTTTNANSQLQEMEKDGLILEAPVNDEGIALLVTLDPNLGKKYGMAELEAPIDFV